MWKTLFYLLGKHTYVNNKKMFNSPTFKENKEDTGIETDIPPNISLIYSEFVEQDFVLLTLSLSQKQYIFKNLKVSIAKICLLLRYLIFISWSTFLYGDAMYCLSSASI